MVTINGYTIGIGLCSGVIHIYHRHFLDFRGEGARSLAKPHAHVAGSTTRTTSMSRRQNLGEAKGQRQWRSKMPPIDQRREQGIQLNPMSKVQPRYFLFRIRVTRPHRRSVLRDRGAQGTPHRNAQGPSQPINGKGRGAQRTPHHRNKRSCKKKEPQRDNVVCS